MATDQCKKNPSLRKRRSFSCFAVSCSGSGAVSLSDTDSTRGTPTRPPPPAARSLAGSSKRRLMMWFFWSRFKKKAKAAPVPHPRAPVALELVQSTNQNDDNKGGTSGHLLLSSIGINPNPTSKWARPQRAGRKLGTGALASCVGLWVMAANLALLVFSGRATALLCFFTCLYVLPSYTSLPSSRHERIGSRSEVDLDSNEHKKRVVMEGLLDRKGRRSSVGESSR